MFSNCSIFVLLGSKETFKIRKLEITKKAQEQLNKKFDEFSEKLTNKESTIYSSDYHLDDDQIYKIDNYQIDKEITDAISNPHDVVSFDPGEFKISEIRSLFIGYKNDDDYTVAFQLIKKNQYFLSKNIPLVLDNKTFKIRDQEGINLDNDIDCLYQNGTLTFESFYNANQILDLSDYQAIATDEEVESFINGKKINYAGDIAKFTIKAPAWARKRIASINKSRVLDNYSASKLQKIAKSYDINIDVFNRKIVLPENNKDLKLVLAFLDEGTYVGAFSKNLYLSNSKREINKK